MLYRVAIITAPLIAALVGWLTNRLAVRMLFEPRKPRRFLGWSWQGVFPKRQRELARKVADIVADELVSPRDLEARLNRTLHSKDLKQAVEGHVHGIVREKLAAYLPLLPERLRDSLSERIKGVYARELDTMMNRVVQRVSENAESILDVRAEVEERIATFSVDKLESMAYAVLSKEFRFIEIVGGVLGFAIGLMQAVLMGLSRGF